jgi:inositol hexakisphosphate/diphosphoinositol-pentakisphosphate kinase
LQAIVDEPVEAWPLCDVMLSWHSEGFPLKKAQAYVELRRPFLINDVHMQDVLLDRRRVYKTLMVRRQWATGVPNMLLPHGHCKERCTRPYGDQC